MGGFFLSCCQRYIQKLAKYSLKMTIMEGQNFSSNMSGNAEIYFDALLEHSTLKYACIVWSMVCIIVISCLLGGVIYYERFGSDQKRIFTNRMVSSICWTLLEALLTIVIPDMVLYCLKSLPVEICYVLAVTRQALIIRLLLLFDSIIIARYIFIFRMKNPLILDDEFWSKIVNVWIVAIRYL